MESSPMNGSRITFAWLAVLTLALGLVLTGCPTGDDDDDDDVADDDVADDDSALDDDDVADDDTAASTEDCWDVELANDGEGTYMHSFGESHERYSYYSEAGVAHILAYVFWDEEERGEWEFSLDVGQGTCPDNGIEWATNSGDTGEVVTEIWASDLGQETFTPGQALFVHLALVNTDDHEFGEIMAYNIDVQFCAPMEE